MLQNCCDLNIDSKGEAGSETQQTSLLMAHHSSHRHHARLKTRASVHGVTTNSTSPMAAMFVAKSVCHHSRAKFIDTYNTLGITLHSLMMRHDVRVKDKRCQRHVQPNTL